MTPQDERAADMRYMKTALRLATKGRGEVSPNPLVGAVVVRDGTIVGRGYHQRFGGDHAEVNAVRNALRRGGSMEGATLYVTLEPCYHYGKTPPCVDLIIAQKFARVVVAVKDPNPLVNGKSIRKLRRAGIRCDVGVRGDEAVLVNEPFFSWFKTKRPFVALKAAQTADGFIARADGSSKWITNTESRKKAHELRATYDAILVGAGTALADDPMLTVRHIRGINPLRVLLDGRLRVPLDAALVTTAAEAGTVIYTAASRDRAKREKILALEAQGVIVVQLRGDRNKRVSLADVLADLADHQIMSILVEGGAGIYGEFLRAKTADILYEFTSAKRFGAGLPGIAGCTAPFQRTLRSHATFGKDALDEYVLTYD